MTALSPRLPAGFFAFSDSCMTIATACASSAKSCVSGPLGVSALDGMVQSGIYAREECLASDFGEEPVYNGKEPHARRDDDGVVHRARVGVGIGRAGISGVFPALRAAK